MMLSVGRNAKRYLLQVADGDNWRSTFELPGHARDEIEASIACGTITTSPRYKASDGRDYRWCPGLVADWIGPPYRFDPGAEDWAWMLSSGCRWKLEQFGGEWPWHDAIPGECDMDDELSSFNAWLKGQE